MITPYKDVTLGKKEQVTRMFDSISGTYDRLNGVISLGIDMRWRKKIVRMLQAKQPKKILDIATGTGDLAILLAKTAPEKIVALDISPKMLAIGAQKIAKKGLSALIETMLGDAENLPFEDASFDAITVAFGVRNFEDLDRGLSEIRRILKPQGTLVILETAVPEKKLYKKGYLLYTKKIVPFVGRLFAKDAVAYSYLSDSANAFPHGKAFVSILERNGFQGVQNIPVTMGVASLYMAMK